MVYGGRRQQRVEIPLKVENMGHTGYADYTRKAPVLPNFLKLSWHWQTRNDSFAFPSSIKSNKGIPTSVLKEVGFNVLKSRLQCSEGQ